MAIRMIQFTIGTNGISPDTLQVGGLQGEDKATLLKFHIDDNFWDDLQAEVVDGSKLIYYINGVDGLGVAHPSDVSVLEGQNIEYYLERCLTRHGGKIQVQVIFDICKDDVSLANPYSYVAQLQLTPSPAHCGSHEDEETISAMAYGAKMSAEVASKAAESAKEKLGLTLAAAKVFEDGAEVIFQGGNAESSFITDIKVENSIIQNGNNPVSGGAVYLAKEELKKYVDEKTRSAEERVW